MKLVATEGSGLISLAGLSATDLLLNLRHREGGTFHESVNLSLCLCPVLAIFAEYQGCYSSMDPDTPRVQLM